MFASLNFIYIFLPLCLLFYYLFKKNNIVLLIFSLLFYSSEGLPFLFLMLFTILTSYINGILIEKYHNKIHFVTSITICLMPLLYFKYTNFFINNINSIFNTDINILKIILPVGISFYTFQLLTYIIDIYKRKEKAEKNIINLALYISFFPQLVAGPIVSYKEMKDQIKNRNHNIDLFVDGIFIFLIGMGKKILLANQLGELCALYHDSEKTILFTWIYAISYSMQVYFDFSGYSEMAIGLGEMFGFNLPKNFNYPFMATSIKDFWKRWHITLSSFFKNYVYIPMGGSKKGIKKTIINLFIVWFLTGMWHGADWTFIIWGIYFFLLLCIEKFILKNKTNIYTKIITPFLIMISFIIFGSINTNDLFITLKSLFVGSFINKKEMFYISNYLIIIIISIIASTNIFKIIFNKIKNIKGFKIIKELFIVIILLLSTAYLVDGSFNPFLYFRF